MFTDGKEHLVLMNVMRPLGVAIGWYRDCGEISAEP
jgi:hypothetical protein